MIARIALLLVEWSAAALAVAAAVSAASTGDVAEMAIAGLAAAFAAMVRAMAVSRAAGRRFDTMFRALRSLSYPSNDAGGL